MLILYQDGGERPWLLLDKKHKLMIKQFFRLGSDEEQKKRDKLDKIVYVTVTP